MSNKDLQRVTICVSDIGQPANARCVPPARRNHFTKKAKIAAQRTLYYRVNADNNPTEIFLRQNVCSLIKSPTKALPQDTQQEPSAEKCEDS
jgi:hypothetical protein